MEEGTVDLGGKKKRVKKKVLKKKAKEERSGGEPLSGDGSLLRPQDQSEESRSLPSSRRGSINTESTEGHVAGVRRRSSGVPEDLPIFIGDKPRHNITVEEKMTAAKRERLGKVVQQPAIIVIMIIILMIRWSSCCPNPPDQLKSRSLGIEYQPRSKRAKSDHRHNCFLIVNILPLQDWSKGVGGDVARRCDEDPGAEGCEEQEQQGSLGLQEVGGSHRGGHLGRFPAGKCKS